MAVQPRQGVTEVHGQPRGGLGGEAFDAGREFLGGLFDRCSGVAAAWPARRRAVGSLFGPLDGGHHRRWAAWRSWRVSRRALSSAPDLAANTAWAAALRPFLACLRPFAIAPPKARSAAFCCSLATFSALARAR